MGSEYTRNGFKKTREQPKKTKITAKHLSDLAILARKGYFDLMEGYVYNLGYDTVFEIAERHIAASGLDMTTIEILAKYYAEELKGDANGK